MSVFSLAGAYATDRGLFKDLVLNSVGISIVSTTSVEADISWPMFLRLGIVLVGHCRTLPGYGHVRGPSRRSRRASDLRWSQGDSNP